MIFKTEIAKNRIHDFYNEQLKNWPVDYESIFVKTENAETHMIRCGKKTAEKLFLFHPVQQNGAAWCSLVGRLSDAFDLYIIDTIGDVGKSTANRKITRPDDYIQWFKSLLAELKLTRVNLAGISYGGWLTLLFSIFAADHVANAVSISPAGGIIQPKFSHILKIAKTALSPSRKNVESLYNYMSYQKMSANKAFIDEAVFITRNAKSNILMPKRFSDKQLLSITTPLGLIAGDREVNYDANDLMNRAKTLIPNVKTRIIPNAGHTIGLDQPDPLCDAILDFLL